MNRDFVTPNKSLQPGSGSSSAARFTYLGPAWLSLRQAAQDVMYYRTPSMRQRVWSGAFWVLGLCAAVAILAWSQLLSAHSRWVLGLFSVWCFAFSGYLSGTWAAFADVIREDWFRNDDDDDFHAA